MTSNTLWPRGLALAGRPGIAIKLVALGIVTLLVALPLLKILAFTFSDEATGTWHDVLFSRLSYNLFWGPSRTRCCWVLRPQRVA